MMYKNNYHPLTRQRYGLYNFANVKSFALQQSVRYKKMKKKPILQEKGFLFHFRKYYGIYAAEKIMEVIVV